MPELPEVEAVTRRLRDNAVGARIASLKVARPGIVRPQTPQHVRRAVTGRAVEACERRGKNILLHLSGGWTVRVHLRMTGNFVVTLNGQPRESNARLWFELEDGRALVLEDTRALGRVTVHRAGELLDLLAELGPEPLSAAFTPEHLIAAAKRSRMPVKTLLMDQTAVAGLGNIYAAEALFRARIHPARAARRLGAARLRALHAAIVDVLRIAVDSAIIAYSQPGEFTEGEQFPAAVYGREGEPCPACDAAIRRMPQGGRSTYYCPRCQK